MLVFPETGVITRDVAVDAILAENAEGRRWAEVTFEGGVEAGFPSTVPTRRGVIAERAAPRVWTIGHSTRSLGQFLELLEAHDIEAVADVRRFPGSRRWPHFAGVHLAQALAGRGLGYAWFPELGGRRQPRPDSPNTAWRSASFRGYADHMETEPFAEGLERLASLACGLRSAVMCAEALWWRCHRGLIADALRWAGFDVHHIQGPGSVVPHPFTSAARLERGRLSYTPR